MRSGGGDYPGRERLQRVLGERAVVGRREIWLPLEHGWREELVAVLREIARASVDG